MSNRLGTVVKELLTKATNSSLFAVEIFNKPNSEFRVQTFIMLMHTAWNSMFLAYFHHNGVKPFYKEKNGYHYKKIDGEKKAWDLSKCIKEFWKEETNPIRKNLEFFVGLRNKIEHYRDQSSLIKLTFGECQSLVSNFENKLVEIFGQKYSLVDSLSLSIQLSKIKNTEREKSILKTVDQATQKVTDYIMEFRSSLSDDIFSDMEFSHKLFLLPKTANHQSKDSIAIEWVDPSIFDHSEKKEIEKISGIIKRKHVEVSNPGKLKPGKVCEIISKKLGFKNFIPSYHHAKCWKYFSVRPQSNAQNPEDCNTKYCQYDVAHKSYVYTKAWVELLLDELSNEKKFKEIMSKK